MNDRPRKKAVAPVPRGPGSRRDGAGVLLERLLPGEVAASEVAEAMGRDGSAASDGLAASAGSAASAILRRVLPAIYFVNTPEARSQRHLELLGRLAPSGSPLLDFHSVSGAPLTECTLCAFDESAPGLLAKLCGTVAALDLSIHTAFIYTLRLGPPSGNSAEQAGRLTLAPSERAEVGRAVALNTFLMSESYFGHDRALTSKTQGKLQSELRRVLSGQSSVSALLARSRRSFAPLQIHELVVKNLAHEEQTRILLRAGDSFGVLFRATSALAWLDLDINAAQVSTREEAADDLFFVTRQNAKLPDEDLASTQASLRALLQGEA